MPSAASDCGRGEPLVHGMTTWNDLDGRTALIHVPPSLVSTRAVPVMLVLHGHLIPADQMPDITKVQEEADREGFIAVFPSGNLGTWNTGGATCGLGTLVSGGDDDIAFMETILSRIEASQCIDRDRVFAMGFSMGGYFANSIACQRPDLVRAVAAHSAGATDTDCVASIKPVFLVHGTSDLTISFDCGKQARDLWVARNGCGTEVDIEMIAGGHCEVSRGCPAGGEVVFCIMEGMGHGWAGSTNFYASGGEQYGPVTERIWQFFSKAP